VEKFTKLNSVFISTDNLQFTSHLADSYPEIPISVDYYLLGLLTVLIFGATGSEEGWLNHFTQCSCSAALCD